MSNIGMERNSHYNNLTQITLTEISFNKKKYVYIIIIIRFEL